MQPINNSTPLDNDAPQDQVVDNSVSNQPNLFFITIAPTGSPIALMLAIEETNLTTDSTINDIVQRILNQSGFAQALDRVNNEIAQRELAVSQLSLKLTEQITKSGNFFIKRGLYTKDNITSYLGNDCAAVMNNALFTTLNTLFKIKNGACYFRQSNLEVTEENIGTIVYSHIDKIKSILEKYAQLTPRAKAAVQWHLCCDEEKAKKYLLLENSKGISIIKELVPIVVDLRIELVDKEIATKASAVVTNAFEKLQDT